MPQEIPTSQRELALRRQITSVGISVALDTGTPPLPLPELRAQIGFTDLFVRGDGAVVHYPTAGTVALAHDDLLAIPHALSVIAAIQAMAYTRAVEQGI